MNTHLIKITTYLHAICLAGFLLSIGSTTNAQSFRAEVEGRLRVEGNIDINHPIDTTSVYIGRSSGNMVQLFEGDSPLQNTFVGAYAGVENEDGYSNSFLGFESGMLNTTGTNNAFFGTESGKSNTTGFSNAFFGDGAGESNINGFRNSFFGHDAGNATIDGDFNAFFGASAGNSNTTGNSNTALGTFSGSAIRSGTRNTFLGSQAGHPFTIDSLDRSIAIGFDAEVICHNCAVLGGTDEDAVNVGINTDNPYSQLTIKQSSGADSTGIRLIDDSDNQSWEIRNGNSNKNLRFRAFADDITSVDVTVEFRRSDGARTVSSDRRLKKDIAYMNKLLDKITAIKPAVYGWKREGDNTRSVGVIAQDLESIFPDLVITDERGYKMVNYSALSVLAIQGLKEQHAVVQEQAQEISKQDKLIQVLLEQNKDLNERLKKVESILEKTQEKKGISSLQASKVN